MSVFIWIIKNNNSINCHYMPKSTGAIPAPN